MNIWDDVNCDRKKKDKKKYYILMSDNTAVSIFHHLV